MPLLYTLVGISGFCENIEHVTNDVAHEIYTVTRAGAVESAKSSGRRRLPVRDMPVMVTPLA